MKYIYSLCFLLLTSISIYGQEVYDIILTKDLDVIQAKISLIGDERIQYTLVDEEVLREMNTKNIRKIKFANGKEQIFENTEEATNKGRNDELDIENDKIAIIPFNFYSERTGRSLGNKGLEVQRYIDEKLYKAYKNKLLDPSETNRRLRESRVNYTNLRSYSPRQLSKVLGVGTIIMGEVSYKMVSKTTFDELFDSDNDVEEALRRNRNKKRIETYDSGDISIEITEEHPSNDIYIDGYDQDISIEISEEYRSNDLYIDGYGQDNYYNDINTGRIIVYSERLYDYEDIWIDIEPADKYDIKTKMTMYKNGKIVFENGKDPFFKDYTSDEWKDQIKALLKDSPLTFFDF